MRSAAKHLGPPGGVVTPDASLRSA